MKKLLCLLALIVIPCSFGAASVPGAIVMRADTTGTNNYSSNVIAVLSITSTNGFVGLGTTFATFTFPLGLRFTNAGNAVGVTNDIPYVFNSNVVLLSTVTIGSGSGIAQLSSGVVSAANLSGDVTTSGTLVTTLANSGVTAGVYGNSGYIPQITVDAKGRITSVTTNAVSGGGSATNIPASVTFEISSSSTLTTGLKKYQAVKNAFTINGYSLIADNVNASVVIDIWMEPDPVDGGGIIDNPPVVADTITASAKPTLSAQLGKFSTTLTGWTNVIPAGSLLGFNIDSASSITNIKLVITGTLN